VEREVDLPSVRHVVVGRLRALELLPQCVHILRQGLQPLPFELQNAGAVQRLQLLPLLRRHGVDLFHRMLEILRQQRPGDDAPDFRKSCFAESNSFHLAQIWNGEYLGLATTSPAENSSLCIERILE